MVVMSNHGRMSTGEHSPFRLAVSNLMNVAPQAAYVFQCSLRAIFTQARTCSTWHLMRPYTAFYTLFSFSACFLHAGSNTRETMRGKGVP